MPYALVAFARVLSRGRAKGIKTSIRTSRFFPNYHHPRYRRVLVSPAVVSTDPDIIFLQSFTFRSTQPTTVSCSRRVGRVIDSNRQRTDA